jgi:hypothetical protein
LEAPELLCPDFSVVWLGTIDDALSSTQALTETLVQIATNMFAVNFAGQKEKNRMNLLELFANAIKVVSTNTLARYSFTSRAQHFQQNDKLFKITLCVQ